MAIDELKPYSQLGTFSCEDNSGQLRSSRTYPVAVSLRQAWMEVDRGL